MDLLPTTEQDAIAAAAAEVLADLGYPERANDRASDGTPVDDELWTLAVDLGWLGLGVAAEHGGVGYGLPEQVMLVRELGRRLAIGPLVAGMVAAAVATGPRRDAVLAGARVACEVGPVGDDGVLALDGPGAGLVLRWASDGVALHEVAGMPVAIAGIDPTVGLARLSVSDEPFAAGGGEASSTAVVLQAAALVGIAEAVRDQAVRHAGARTQFGRPIGSFQAIKHMCADMAVRAEAAWRQTCWAALAVRDGHEDRGLHTRAARLVAESAALDGAAANIQVHGAMGFTAEHTAHLYLKRARALSRAMRPLVAPVVSAAHALETPNAAP